MYQKSDLVLFYQNIHLGLKLLVLDSLTTNHNIKKIIDKLKKLFIHCYFIKLLTMMSQIQPSNKRKTIKDHTSF